MSHIDKLKVNGVDYDIHDNRFVEGTTYSDTAKVQRRWLIPLFFQDKNIV